MQEEVRPSWSSMTLYQTKTTFPGRLSWTESSEEWISWNNSMNGIFTHLHHINWCSQDLSVETLRLMEEILYRTSWYGKNPIVYRVLYIPGGAGFLPSTACQHWSTLYVRVIHPRWPVLLGGSHRSAAQQISRQEHITTTFWSNCATQQGPPIISI